MPFNIVDLVIAIALLIGLANGYRRGFWLSFFQYVGMVVGVVVGAALAPALLSALGVTGLLVPISLLPSFVRPISWLLAPTWGFRAIQEAALGRTPWPDIGMCFVLSAVYLVIGGSCLVAFEYVARSRGSLRLT